MVTTGLKRLLRSRDGGRLEMTIPADRYPALPHVSLTRDEPGSEWALATELSAPALPSA